MNLKTKLITSIATIGLISTILTGCTPPVDENNIGAPKEPLHTFTPQPKPTETQNVLQYTTEPNKVTDYWVKETKKSITSPKWNKPDAQVNTKTGDMVIKETNYPDETLKNYITVLQNDNTLTQFDSSTEEDKNADYTLYFFENDDYVLEITDHPDRKDPNDDTSDATFFRIYVKPSN